MIVVDGRTDAEKLLELLNNTGECSEVDFKETLDFTMKRDELDFIKDAVAMFNRFPGGYIIVGVDNDGKPSPRSHGTDWTQFDGQRLTDKVRIYVDAPITIISQVHTIEDHTICLICMMSLKDGLPIPFKKLGQDSDNKVVFRKGEFVRRDGAGNREIMFNQWPDILAQHDTYVREQESRRIDMLIERVTAALSDQDKTPPLVLDAPELATMKALANCFEHGSLNKIHRYVNQVGMRLGKDKGSLKSLTSVAIHAAEYYESGLFNLAVDILFSYYKSLPGYNLTVGGEKLNIATAVYEIGAAAVRSRFWTVISDLVNKPVKFNRSTGYMYESWIRDCQVTASNLGLFPERHGGMMISLALNEIKDHPCLRPDAVQDDEDNEHWEQIQDSLLDSLCQFDFLYCLCVYAVTGGKYAGAYPACIYYKDIRIRPAINAVFGTDDEMRKALLPNSSDNEIAKGMQTLWRLMLQESMQYGNFFSGFDTMDNIQNYIDENLPNEN